MTLLFSSVRKATILLYKHGENHGTTTGLVCVQCKHVDGVLQGHMIGKEMGGR